jgi:hypothetical protein
LFGQIASFVSSLFSGEASEYESSVLLAVDADRATLKAAKEQGLQIGQSVRLRHLGMTVTTLKIPTGEDAVAVLDRLRKKGLPRIMLNHYYRLDGINRQEHAGPEYPNTLIDWPSPCVSCGLGIKIGMVDSYVDARVPALSRQRIVRRVFASKAAATEIDHGTAIASILIGCHSHRFCGLIPDAVLFAAAAFSEENSSDPRATALAIVTSLNWLVAEKVQVINLSFSGRANDMLHMALKKILARKIPVIAAAGNYGREGPPAYPAAYPGVIAVTAVDRFRRPYPDANQGKYISFAAPGVRVPVPCGNGDICYKSGTSYAAAYCTALAARIRHQWKRKKSMKSLIAALRNNVEDLGTPGRDSVFGWGLVRCGKGCRGRR